MRTKKSGTGVHSSPLGGTNGFLNRRWVGSNPPGVTGSKNQKKTSNRDELLNAARSVGASDVEAHHLLRDLLAVGEASRNGGLTDAAAGRAVVALTAELRSGKKRRQALAARLAPAILDGRRTLGSAVRAVRGAA